MDHPYRARAFWTAIGALSVVSLVAAGAVDSYFGSVTDLTSLLAEASVWGVVFFGLYGWMASNIDVAIVSDYFNRDSLRWMRGGKSTTIGLFVVGYIMSNLPPWGVLAALVTGWAGSLLYDVITVIFLFVIVYAAAVLVIVYRRILDKRIKTYTKWVIASLSMMLVIAIVGDSSVVLVALAAIAYVYCMHRSIGSLAIKTKSLPS